MYGSYTVSDDTFGVVAFHSRQQVIRFDQILKEHRIPSTIISTPRGVSIGCGVSLSFPMQYMAQVKRIYETEKIGSLIGFYQGRKVNGKQTVRPV